MLMDIVVTKMFPVGYIEAVKEEGSRPTPRCEAEEREEENLWRVSFNTRVFRRGTRMSHLWLRIDSSLE